MKEAREVALVVGGSRGIGKAIALAFAEAGAEVMICGRQLKDLAAAADELHGATGRRIELEVADLSCRDQAERRSAVTAALLATRGRCALPRDARRAGHLFRRAGDEPGSPGGGADRSGGEGLRGGSRYRRAG